MAYLKHSKDSLRIYEAYQIKDALKANNYIFDGSGYWYKLNEDIPDAILEYRNLLADVDLLLGELTLNDVEKFLNMTTQEAVEAAVEAAMKNPLDGIEIIRKRQQVQNWRTRP